ncbi:MAG: type II toxin-antitoxin system RelE/ParE family toxin [Trueperaceae bacterium]
MTYTVNTSDEFADWFDEQDEALQDSITAMVSLLIEHGPNLRRPYADTLKGSKLSNLKELRVQHKGDPYRILFAFDPEREALLLVGGDKTGDKRWYDKMIPLAEKIFANHLEMLEEKEQK